MVKKVLLSLIPGYLSTVFSAIPSFSPRYFLIKEILTDCLIYAQKLGEQNGQWKDRTFFNHINIELHTLLSPM